MTGSVSPRPFVFRRSEDMTQVELTWVEKQIENWLRFGHRSGEKILDRRRSVVSFAPNSIFAFVRWTSNDYGTIQSRIDIVRAIVPGERYQTLPFVRPGGDILLRIDGWPKADAAPDYWRHVHNRLTVGYQPRAYTRERHEAWLKRRSIAP